MPVSLLSCPSSRFRFSAGAECERGRDCGIQRSANSEVRGKPSALFELRLLHAGGGGSWGRHGLEAGGAGAAGPLREDRRSAGVKRRKRVARPRDRQVMYVRWMGFEGLKEIHILLKCM